MYLVPNKISGNSIPHFAKRDKEKKAAAPNAVCSSPFFERFPVFCFSLRFRKRYRQQGLQRRFHRRREQARQSRRRYCQ